MRCTDGDNAATYRPGQWHAGRIRAAGEPARQGGKAMSKISAEGYFGARSLSCAVGSRVERTCSVCGRNFMMDAGSHVYRTDFGVQCSYSCFQRAKAGGKRRHERKPRTAACEDIGAIRAQCIAQLEENQRALEGTHGKERERIQARMCYWKRKLAETEHDEATIGAAKEE